MWFTLVWGGVTARRGAYIFVCVCVSVLCAQMDPFRTPVRDAYAARHQPGVAIFLPTVLTSSMRDII